MNAIPEIPFHKQSLNQQPRGPWFYAALLLLYVLVIVAHRVIVQ